MKCPYCKEERELKLRIAMPGGATTEMCDECFHEFKVPEEPPSDSPRPHDDTGQKSLDL